MGMKRFLRADLLLAENIRTLLSSRHLDASALALWCGHKPPWISKFLAGERGLQLKDLNKIADFFGLTVAELFQQGISHLTERRRGQRRAEQNRRSGQERRGQDRSGHLHPDVIMRFPPHHDHEEITDRSAQRTPPHRRTPA